MIGRPTPGRLMLSPPGAGRSLAMASLPAARTGRAAEAAMRSRRRMAASCPPRLEISLSAVGEARPVECDGLAAEAGHHPLPLRHPPDLRQAQMPPLGLAAYRGLVSRGR